MKYLRFFRVVRLVRVLKLKVLFDEIDFYSDLPNFATNFLSIFKLLLTLTIFIHWLACFFHYMGLWESEKYAKTWLKNYAIDDSPWSTRYIASLYFSITTLNTVGYGDILPLTTSEKLFAMMQMLVASVLFGFTMTKVNSIADGLEGVTDIYKYSIS
jgi:hypothetical protein